MPISNSNLDFRFGFSACDFMLRKVFVDYKLKKKIVEEVAEGAQSQNKIAYDYGVFSSSITRWKRKFEDDVNEVLPLNKKTAHQGREPFNEDSYVVVQEFIDNRRDDGFAVKIAHLSLLRLTILY